MSKRFEAEELLREAASGAIPAEGDLLVRGPNGWFFGGAGGGSGGAGGAVASFSDLSGNIFNFQVGTSAVTQHEAALSILFTQIFGIATRVQLPVDIPYEDEVNTFTQRNTFTDIVMPNFEAFMRFVSND